MSQTYTLVSRTITRDHIPHLPSHVRLVSTKMSTTRYKDTEWETIIASTLHGVLTSPDPPRRRVLLDQIAGTVDHTLLKLGATTQQVDALCAEARVHVFATVCVRVGHVAQCRRDLSGTVVGIACVIGFHEGTQDVGEKVSEAKRAVAEGATELDVVVNVGKLKRREWDEVYGELSAIRAVTGRDVRCKIILETALLKDEEIVAGCVLAAEAGFDFVKTSTGFLKPEQLPAGVTVSGATVEHVRLMSKCCLALPQTSHTGTVKYMKVKASGGIRTLDDAIKMLEVGAERLGTSGGVWIAKEADQAEHHRSRSREDLKKASVTEILPDGEARPGLQTRLFSEY